MTKKIGVIGSGEVGEALADGFLKHGHAVMRGSREPQKLAKWKAGAGAHAHVGTFVEAATFGEIVVLAVKGSAALAAAEMASAGLDGKVVIDTTNPIADSPPVAGVIAYAIGPNESLLEKLQEKVPRARFVKGFSCVGAALMVNPKLKGGPPTMFIAGNDAAAKAEVTKVLDAFGWETEDCGDARAARGIEPLAILWCIPGFKKNDWTHAFKMLRP